jgi:hypothetical protein
MDSLLSIPGEVWDLTRTFFKGTWQPWIRDHKALFFFFIVFSFSLVMAIPVGEDKKYLGNEVGEGILPLIGLYGVVLWLLPYVLYLGVGGGLAILLGICLPIFISRFVPSTVFPIIKRIFTS